MDHSASIAYALVIPLRHHLALSALPDSPVVDDRDGLTHRTAAVRARLATALHRLAWAVEPGAWTP
jgi:hypothetical protein